jgi:hypothetical protein
MMLFEQIQAHGGLAALLQAMRAHADSLDVTLAAFACLRGMLRGGDAERAAATAAVRCAISPPARCRMVSRRTHIEAPCSRSPRRIQWSVVHAASMWGAMRSGGALQVAGVGPALLRSLLAHTDCDVLQQRGFELLGSLARDSRSADAIIAGSAASRPLGTCPTAEVTSAPDAAINIYDQVEREDAAAAAASAGVAGATDIYTAVDVAGFLAQAARAARALSRAQSKGLGRLLKRLPLAASAAHPQPCQPGG